MSPATEATEELTAYRGTFTKVVYDHFFSSRGFSRGDPCLRVSARGPCFSCDLEISRVCFFFAFGNFVGVCRALWDSAPFQ